MVRKRGSKNTNPRRKKALSAREPPPPKPKECRICHDIILQHLGRHEKICKINSISRRELEGYRLAHVAPAPQNNRVQTPDDFMPQDERPTPPMSPAAEFPPMDLDPPTLEDENMCLPQRFIYVKHHQHSGKPDEIIALDSVASSESQQSESVPKPTTDGRPWLPFRSLADASFAYRCVSQRMANQNIDEDLHLLRTEWAENSKISFKNHREMEQAIDAAREGNIRFQTTSVPIEFEGREFGGSYDVEIRFRNPWKVMKRWICDETLVPVSTWFSQQRYLCLGGAVDLTNALYEEPCTGSTWGAVDDALPGDEKYPACYVPAHIWLDKGLVSTKVKMHPFLIRGCWIESATRNGSGNGGATLLGFVLMPQALREIDPKTLRGVRRTEYDRLKRTIYHTVCRVVMASLERRSHNGEVVRFGDGVSRTAYPGILIESMDFEEMAAWLAIRNSRSNHPCPQCLVHHDDLHKLFRRWERRTSESMSRIVVRAAKLNVTDREELLKKYGLHNFTHFLWTFRHSDPYAAASYDLLHYFDGGKWGRHVWVLIKECLQSHALASKFNDYMSQFPRWRGLKHISSPTTIDYSEGQTFVDILKCALPCLVQLLPRNSCLVRLVRAMQKTRIMLGLSVTTRTRLDHLNDLQREYERACNEVHDDAEFAKDFNFLKQHSLSHAAEDFMAKGTSRNMNTRVGEGFQQEVEKMYQKTNGKNAEYLIGVQDEREEAMARVKMAIDNWRQSQADAELEDSELTTIPAVSASPGHWQLGSPEPLVSAHGLEVQRMNDPAFRDFNMRLREYIAEYHPWSQVRLEQQIQIQQCKVLYVDYQSRVDWRSARDILRCNPHFHGAPRFDCMIFEDGDDSVAIGQFHFIFRCHLPGGATLDLAMVQPYSRTIWQPNTRTDCPIREKLPLKKCHFISLEHIVRGALLAPIYGGKNGMYYIIDCVDEDMYLRINNID
ncbi:hypothetical protein C8F04DRAFT_1388930 [Mycena alexandri]|uniref:Uncharacterized protein n=1 Tax=Mycena alexandri TaxID=1745969 RepID=A0AAD6TE79_9AGAR|nr:hypothetical protein C8F04DRAFT_1388930 [Mycena alexandri]